MTFERLRPAVFLDRDGVINAITVTDGVPHPPRTIYEFTLLPGVEEAVDRLLQVGFVLVVVTNQPDVARGTQSRQMVEDMNNRVRELLPVLDVLTCFHDNADRCNCRKPKPGLLYRAEERWRLDLKRSFLVGDRWSDIVAGQSAGCRSILIDRPYSGRERCQPDHSASDLSAAAEWIIQLRTERRSA